jgi:hypothetical protein
MTDAPVTHTAWNSPGAILREWTGLLGAPLVWFLQFEASYGLVERACASRSMWPLHLLSLAALAGTIGALLLAHRTRRTAADLPQGELTGGPRGRAWLLGTTGMLIGGFFILLILAQWIPTLLIDPCRR